MTKTANLTSAQIKSFARSIGVDLVGIASAAPDSIGEEKLRNFIRKKRNGEMDYLEDYQKRVHPEQLLPGAKSVIVIAVNYYRPVDGVPAGHGQIARYAYGRDYHKVLKNLLKQLEIFILKNSPEAKTKICVDSSPLLEKNYAVRAGLGFIGKNTTLITPEFGSFVLLGEIICDLELEYDTEKTGTCGTCTRCLDACPTKAILGPGELDARRCISYLTIETSGPIPDEFHAAMGDRIFGCDICQEVCPYNKVNAKPVSLKAFKEVKIAGQTLSLDEILAIETDEQFLQKFAGSPLMRAKRKGLQRNARIAVKNRASDAN